MFGKTERYGWDAHTTYLSVIQVVACAFVLMHVVMYECV